MARWFLDLRAAVQGQPYVDLFVSDGVTVRIASYNIRKGGSRRREAIAEVLSALDADVTVLQEATDPEVVGCLPERSANRSGRAGPDHSVALLARRRARRVRWHVMGLNRTFIEAKLPVDIRLFAVHLSSGLSRRGERRRLERADGGPQGDW